MDLEGSQKEEEPIGEELGTSGRKKGESSKGWGNEHSNRGKSLLGKAGLRCAWRAERKLGSWLA